MRKGHPIRAGERSFPRIEQYALSSDPRERQAQLIAWTAGQTAPVLSLDVPSGLDATSGA